MKARRECLRCIDDALASQWLFGPIGVLVPLVQVNTAEGLRRKAEAINALLAPPAHAEE
jgi:hypothetical protein